jgi:hypothetical protein
VFSKPIISKDSSDDGNANAHGSAGNALMPVTFPAIQPLCQAVLQRFSTVRLRCSIQGKV